MQVASLRLSFASEPVREIPDAQGVFTLWDHDECVLIGHTPWNLSLRDYLREHLALRDEGALKATHFTWEITPTPKSREIALVGLWLERHGKLPRYNREGTPLLPRRTCVTDLRAR
jgi:hypothetical protein